MSNKIFNVDDRSNFTPESKKIFQLIERCIAEDEKVAERILSRYSYDNINNVTKL